MGFLDKLVSSKPDQEVEKLKKELAILKENNKKLQFELEQVNQANIKLIDKTNAFFQRLRLLIASLSEENLLQKAWEVLDTALSIKKGAVLERSEYGWRAVYSCGFKDGNVPIVPYDEDSIITYVGNHGVSLSIPYIRKQDDLNYLEKRGVLPDTKMAVPIRVKGTVVGIIVICSYSGNIFKNEDDIETVELVATVLSLVIANIQVINEQKKALTETVKELQESTKKFAELKRIFERLVSPEVIEYLQQNHDKISLGGFRQNVVIMFVDIRGFTRMVENVASERIIELLNSYFTKLTDIVYKYHGMIDKFMGDAAMVLFGTPYPVEKPVDKAVFAAFEIMDMVAENMPEWVRLGFPAFSVGIGITYDEVVVGNVGSDRLSSFTAIGDAVNLASRLASIAQGGEILVSENVYESITEWQGKIEQRPSVQIKGKSEPVDVYCLSKYEYYKAGFCPKCRTPIREGIRFCGKCGYKRF